MNGVPAPILNREPGAPAGFWARWGLLLGLAMLLAIGVVDWASGPEVHVSIFYFLPIMWVAWVAGRWQAVIMAVVAGATWLAAELLTRVAYSHAWIPFWNASVRLGTFLITGHLTARVAERKRNEQQLLQTQNELLQGQIDERRQAEAKLTELNETLEQKVRDRTAAVEARSIELGRSEAALRKQTAVLQSILNSMGDGVIVADAHGRLLLSNPEAERLLCLAAGEGAFDEALRRLQPADEEQPIAADKTLLWQAVRGQCTLDGAEFRFVQPAGASGPWLRTTARPLVDEHGAIQGGVIVFSDVTARRMLEKQIAEISEREQRRIGQDLHDGLCQHLVSTAFACTSLNLKMNELARPEAGEVYEIGELVKQAISQARTLARGLHPVQLEADGLASALEELARSVGGFNSVSCHFQCETPVAILDFGTASNLYRIAQEAVHNALKHGQARNIVLSLDQHPGRAELQVKDDGVGLPHEVPTGNGMGLHIMNYRARMIGAELKIRRLGESGTIVSCSWPT